MPDGSSSAAPVMIPGPSDFSSVRIQRDGADVGKRKLGYRCFLGIGARLDSTLSPPWRRDGEIGRAGEIPQSYRLGFTPASFCCIEKHFVRLPGSTFVKEQLNLCVRVAVAHRLRRPTQGPVEHKQDQRRLQNRHCALSCVLLDKISISLSIGIAQPECGYNAADWRGNRLRPGAAETKLA